MKKINILGGGIGGLTLAVALQRAGFNVTVFEQASDIKPLGAGLVLAANAVKALHEIGIDKEVLAAGCIIRNLRIKDHRGRILNETDAHKINLQFGFANNFAVHRADLHQVLTGLLKPGTLQLSKKCIDINSHADGVEIKFSDGFSSRADVLIACDGIHSVARKKLLPHSKPRYAGYTCWRAIVNDPPSSLDITETSETWGPSGRFGIVPLSNNRVYWFACINARFNDPAMRSVRLADLLNYFGGFHSPVPELLMRTRDEDLIWNDIIDLKPIRRFAYGRIALMGDAAHATTPNMGQGACMAIEDAVVLAKCLAKIDSIELALIDYEVKRISRTTHIVNESWRIGKVAQWSNPFLVKLRNALITHAPARTMEKQMEFLYNVSFH